MNPCLEHKTLICLLLLAVNACEVGVGAVLLQTDEQVGAICLQEA